MYKIKLLHFKKQYLLEEMIKIFLRPDQYRLLADDEEAEDALVFNVDNHKDRNLIKQQIYNRLAELTGNHPEWGILTGIRPVKLTGELYEELGSPEETLNRLTDYYYIDEDRAKLLLEMYMYQQQRFGTAEKNTAGVYIGIPFCPTRCVYCSFASNQVADAEIERYLIALHQEIEFVGQRMRQCGIFAESIYIGGGTPTTLNSVQLDHLIRKIKDVFDFSQVKEFTIEAGRPDTITIDKLDVLKAHNIDRISINPQSMKNETLQVIGRNHTPDQIRDAFTMAKQQNFDSINADVIAGLPGESLDDFTHTLEEMIKLNAENITVHSLAVKRASKLVDIDKDYHYKQGAIVSEMLDASRRLLERAGYMPYYLYRQKHMAGAYENTGYSLPGKECLYNIRIMDEHQTIIALGAGGITKVYFPLENRLERVPNVTNYEEYIKRIDEMLERKELNLFKEVEK